ncbi:MAG: EVE domain-containing protein [Holophagaceae bacterium]|nr:EVE domain-containing protein [Holophagaceae bacterium]
MTTELTKEQFIEILLDREVTKKENIALLQAIYSRPGHRAAASQVCKELGYTAAGPCNSLVGWHAKRIKTKFGFIEFSVRDNGKNRYWDLFFDYEGKNYDTPDEDGLFPWILKPNLVMALQETGMTGEFDVTREGQIGEMAVNEHSAWIFQGNPLKYKIDDYINDFARENEAIIWIVKQHKKKIKKGDRAYIWRSGTESGIIASGIITCNPELRVRDSSDRNYWIEEPRDKSRLAVEIKIEKCQTRPPLVLKSELKENNQAKELSILSSPQGTNFEVPKSIETVINEMIRIASGFVADSVFEGYDKQSFQNTNMAGGLEDPNELSAAEAEMLPEGAKRTIIVNVYERNPQAREQCINEHGHICVVCGFDFGMEYGDIGKDYIHVHHKKPLHEIKEGYNVDPINDLVPICPNCHSMTHKVIKINNGNWETAIDELKRRYKDAQSKK